MLALSKRKGHKAHDASEGHVGAGASGASGAPGTKAETWTPPIVRCVSTKGEGIAELVAAVERHRAWGEDTEAGRARRRARLAEEMRDGLREALIDAAQGALGAHIDEAVRAVDAREVDPYTATETLIGEFRGGKGRVIE
jgi:LAO/AO transport system kinase